MEQHDIHDYLERYFRLNDCDILCNDGKTLHIQLSVDMDKRLMNRPFYWKYIENTEMKPEPMKLKLITDPSESEETDGEFIHFGSPRLHQIFRSAQEIAAYTRLYEDIGEVHESSLPLEPWIGINAKTSYRCDRKMDVLVSYGLQLISGRIVENFHDRLRSLRLTRKIPDYCFTISPLIKPQSGLKRLETRIMNNLKNEDDTWAKEAEERWMADLRLLDQFYENETDMPESYVLEKDAIREQYEPKIDVKIISGGLFYLTQHALRTV